MEDFLREYFSFLNKAVEIVAAIVAILVYKKYRKTKVKYFLWFLIYVFILELIGGYTVYVSKFEFLQGVKNMLKDTLIEKNYWWYNIFWTIGSAMFFSSYFIISLKTKAFKKTLILGRAIFLIASLVFILFNLNDFFTSSLTFSTILGAILVLLSTVLYFIEILQSQKVLSFYKSVNFYIAAVVFVWFLIRTPIIFYDVYFSVKDWDYVILKAIITLSTNIFMYVTFSIALLWCKPQNN
jgi:hypothetical protein